MARENKSVVLQPKPTPFTLLFVDDEPDIVDSLHRTFRKDFTVLLATSGEEAIALLRTHAVDLIISDQRMPGLTGVDVLKAAQELHPESIRILLTGYSDMESLIACVNEASIYKYLTKPWEPEHLKLTVTRALEHLGLERRLKQTVEHLKTAYRDAVTMLSFACEGKDEDTGLHIRRVQHLSESLAREMGFDPEAAEHMGLMSILHDVGKLHIPDSILKKATQLNPEEWIVMREHPTHGVRILGDNPFYDVAREIAGGHHENWDGTGYPVGLKGEQIPLSARIVKVADKFDALISRRPYKDPWPLRETLDLIRSEAGRQFDPAVVDAFFRLHAAGTIDAIGQWSD
jgi:putative two-component system response regulator